MSRLGERNEKKGRDHLIQPLNCQLAMGENQSK